MKFRDLKKCLCRHIFSQHKSPLLGSYLKCDKCGEVKTLEEVIAEGITKPKK